MHMGLYVDIHYTYVSSEVLGAVIMKTAGFLDVAPSNLVFHHLPDYT
jgi:hypothetical protein